MRIGVFTALWGDLPFEQALDKAAAFGVTAVEIGVGGYPGEGHAPVADLLKSQTMRDEWLSKIQQRGLILSAISCHNNPLHPDKAIAQEADRVIKSAFDLASQLGIGVVNGFSGLPAGSASDTQPN